MWPRNQNILYPFAGFFLNNNTDKIKIKFYSSEHITEYSCCASKSCVHDNKLCFLWGKLINKYVTNLIR